MSHTAESEIYVPHTDWDSVIYEEAPGDDEPHYLEILYDE